MHAITSHVLLGLNRVGTLFWVQAAGVFIQSSVLIAFIFVVDLLLRRRTKAIFRYCLWLLILVKLLLPPQLCMPTGIGYWGGDLVLTVPLNLETPIQSLPTDLGSAAYPQAAADLPYPEAGPGQLAMSPTEDRGPITASVSSQPPVTWQALAFVLWLVGVLVLGALLVQRLLFVRALVAQSTPGEDSLRDILDQCRRQLGVRQHVDIRISPNIQSPVVCGLIRPVILVHAPLLEKLSSEELKAVLIHELAHVQRRDLWVNLLQTLLQIVYFYHPLVWFTNIMVRRIREQAVDETVLVALGAEAERYSHTLIDIANMTFWRTNLGLRLVGVAESKQALERRIKHMLTRPIPKSARVGFLGVLVVVLMAALLLPMAKAGRTPAPEAEAQAAQPQFVRLVIATDKMSFEGMAVTWEELPDLLAKVINPELTILELAVTTKKIPFDRFGAAKEQAQKLVDTHGFQSLKYIGVAKLGSKGGQSGRTQRTRTSSSRTSAKPVANPVVLATSPACMTNDVFPNTKEITVTFDQPMMDGAWSWTGGGETFPEIVGKIHYDRKKTTCTLPVKLQPGKVYRVGINSPSHKNFKNSRRMPAQRYAIVFATADENGNPTPIPDDLQAWARRINQASRPSSVSPPSSQRQGQATELALDDGSRAGKQSIAGGGHAVRFTTSGDDSELQAIRIYGSRYGEQQAPNEDFSVWLCDKNFRELKHFSFPYALFKQRGRAKWVTLDVEHTKLPTEFILCVAFDPHQTKGIYLYYDGSSSGHSFVGTPGGELDAYNKGDWLLRALVSGSPGETSSQGGIQARIDAAGPGDTVIVPKGTYTEPVVIGKSLILKGESRDGCIFELTSDQPAISLATRGRGHVTLSGLTVRWQLATSNKQNKTPFALQVKDSKALIEDCHFLPLGGFKRCPVAVQADGFSNLTIKACEFKGFEYTIGYMGGAKGLIQDCVIRDSGHQGATVYSGSTLTVERTIVTGSEFHALRNTGGTLHVKDCLLIDNANRGIYLGSRSGRGSIVNNLLIGNGTGISGFARASYTIENNVVVNSGFSGIDMRDSCKLSIRNNILSGSMHEDGGGLCLFQERRENNNKIGANTFWNNNADLKALEKIDDKWQDTKDQTALGQTEDMIQADPLFTDPAKGDFSLKPGPVKDQNHGLTDPDTLKALWQTWKSPK